MVLRLVKKDLQRTQVSLIIMSDDDRRSDSEEEEEEEEEEDEVPELPKPPPRNEADEARKRMEDEERRKREEKEKKKAEVRKRLEEACKAKKAKKGFMTPERKKKLRLMLRKNAAEQLKKEQERKAQERRKAIKERVGEPKSLDGANEATLIKIIQEYHERIYKIEEQKYESESLVRRKEFVINELMIELQGLHGRFVKPVLRKVHNKYQGKLSKAKSTKTADLNLRLQLKQVEKAKFSIEEDAKEKPQWALGAKSEKPDGAVGED